MAKWASASVLDGGIDFIKANAVFMTLIKAYAANDSFATAITGNGICSVAMTSADFVKSSVSTSRRLTTATKTGTASANSGATPNLHVAFHDGTNVLWVTDETSDQVITSGNDVNFPAFTWTQDQPT
jgi:hypothetical protein